MWLLSEAASGTANSSYTPSTYQMKFINNSKPAFKIQKSIAHAINRNWELSVTGIHVNHSASSFSDGIKHSIRNLKFYVAVVTMCTTSFNTQ